jgi:hypothetical protein
MSTFSFGGYVGTDAKECAFLHAGELQTMDTILNVECVWSMTGAGHD